MPFVYILECRDKSFYVGSTWDLERRLSEHQEGLGAAYTRRRRPVRLRWHAAYDSIAEAYAMEKRVQGWSRAKRIALIEGRLDDLPGLSRRGPARPTDRVSRPSASASGTSTNATPADASGTSTNHAG
jgi:putative endonuclease